MPRVLLMLCVLAGGAIARANEPNAVKTSEGIDLSLESIRSAIAKAIPHLQNGSAGSANERQCFTCHNQAIPVFALTAATQRGFDIDKENLRRQLKHTWNHLEKGTEAYRNGKGQGGQVMTAGYAMWTLEISDWKSDEVTTAVTHYLVEYQKGKGHWISSSNRLPSAGSSFTATYVALRALSHYGTDEQSDDIKRRREDAAKWVRETEPQDTEDRVFRLRTLLLVGCEDSLIRSSISELLEKQQVGGGWSQSDDREPDAYATGTVLAALQDVGGFSIDHQAILAGCRYLINSQLEDGTWHVVTHAKPIQTYYESGFPHDEDQFISIAATGWATLALAQALPAQVSD